MNVRSRCFLRLRGRAARLRRRRHHRAQPGARVLFLVLAFFTAAALWLLLDAEFLAIALVVVYVGAVMVLFLFVVMMLDINLERVREGFWRNLPLALVVGGIMVCEMVDDARLPLFRRGSPGTGAARLQQHQGARARALHRLRLRVRDRGGDPAGGDRRGHRAHAAPAQGQPSQDPRAAQVKARTSDRRAAGVDAVARRKQLLDDGALIPHPLPGARRDPVRRSAWWGSSSTANMIVLLMAIELMLLAVNLNFIAFSHYLGDLGGQVFVFFILTVAAAESAIGLAILVVLFRNLNTIDVEDLDSLKG